MPWNISSVFKARERFIELVFDRHLPVAQACRRTGISRKTGFKFLRRFRQAGRSGLHDLSRRPRRSPRKTSPRWRKAILKLRGQHPHWGSKKIHHYLRRIHPYQRLPRPRTIQRWLGLLGQSTKRRRKAPGGPVIPYKGLTPARHPTMYGPSISRDGSAPLMACARNR
jgi:hypothetical protein